MKITDHGLELVRSPEFGEMVQYVAESFNEEFGDDPTEDQIVQVWEAVVIYATLALISEPTNESFSMGSITEVPSEEELVKFINENLDLISSLTFSALSKHMNVNEDELRTWLRDEYE